jgi:ElaB/YqjD/DUF883 family membrane-anchored ribosome-binding protein
MRTKTGNGPNVDLERLLEDLKVIVKDGQQLLKTRWGGVKERAISSAKTTDRTVREHPYQTIGIVFGLGLVAGLLCSTLLRGEEVEEEEEE